MFPKIRCVSKRSCTHSNANTMSDFTSEVLPELAFQNGDSFVHSVKLVLVRA